MIHHVESSGTTSKHVLVPFIKEKMMSCRREKDRQKKSDIDRPIEYRYRKQRKRIISARK